MKCASAVARGSTVDTAIREAAAELVQQLGCHPDLLMAFLSGAAADEAEEVHSALQAELNPQVLLGCTSDSVIGTRQEIENEDAISLWGAVWPGARLTPMHLQLERAVDGSVITGWSDSFRDQRGPEDFMLVLGEPFSFPADLLLERLSEDHPDLAVVGGMASRGFSPGTNKLLLNGEVLDQGAVALLVQGNVRLIPIVSQGCRPVGQSMVITKAERNELLELGGTPILKVLEKLFRESPVREQQAMQRGLLVGRVIDERQDRFGIGDFLIRGVVGIDEERGSLAVSDYFRPGQTIQFHIRDQESAHDEFTQMLDKPVLESRPLGGLLFSCNGRGSQMFEQADHDATCVADRFENLPIAGFFAAGEIGPVSGRSFMHGFTASLALFAENDAQAKA